MARLPTVLSTVDLPLAELTAARLDGEVFPLDECFSVCDLPVGRVERGQAVASMTPRRAVAERATAAWIHGARERPPTVHSFARDVTDRAVAAFTQRFAVREVVFADGDVIRIGGCRTTSALRTIGDIARIEDRWTDVEATTIRALADIGSVDEAACVDYLGRSARLPGKRRAVGRIRSALSRR